MTSTTLSHQQLISSTTLSHHLAVVLIRGVSSVAERSRWWLSVVDGG